MNKQEFAWLEQASFGIRPIDLANQADRTLIYGYTCERHTFHVYLQDGKFHKFVYRGGYAGTNIHGNRYEVPVEVVEETVWDSTSFVEPSELLPNKRTYPERCDYDFCVLLRSAGMDLNFTSWMDLPEHYLQNHQFHGRLIGDYSLVEQ